MQAVIGRVSLAGAAIAGALWAISVLAPASAQGVITLDHAVRNCRLIGNKEARLSCYDRVIDEADASIAGQSSARAAPPTAPVASAAPAAPAAPSPAVQVTQPPAPATARVASAPPAKPAAAPKGDALKIAAAKWASDGGVEITMGDGTVWHQIDSTSLRILPRPGQTLSISGGVFGGKHLCQYGAEETFDCRQQ